MDRVNRIKKQLDPSFVAGSSAVVSITAKVNGVAIVTINNPPVNTLSDEVTRGIESCFQQAFDDSSVKAIVLTGTGKSFMAGMDIAKIRGVTKDVLKPMSDMTYKTLEMMENGPKPSVCAVNGVCLGGGLEVAMACSARVTWKKPKLGLPELNLGLIPGAAGTQRLPRLVGVEQAVKMTLAGRPVNGKKAKKIGLVDVLVRSPKDLIPASVKLALDIASGKVPRSKALLKKDKVKNLPKIKLVIDGARLKAAAKGKGLVPHPNAYLDAVWEGVTKGGAAGCKKEQELFLELVYSPTSLALRHFFFASKASSKIPGLKHKPNKMGTVAVIGAGTMGAGIIIVYLMAGFNVILKEYNEKFLELGMERIVGTIQRMIKKRRMNPMFLEGLLRNLTPQTTYDNFDKCDVVVEAVIENLKLKQGIFKTLEEVCKPSCLLATNTSTIDINQVGALTKAQDRIIGLHFFSPAHMMPLLEIIRTEHTSQQAIADCMAMSKKIRKTPALVGNCVGFTANRVFFPYGQSASFLADQGVSPYRIDKALEKWGMPMGVFKMSDLSGNDVFGHVSGMINGAYGERCYNSTLGFKLLEDKKLGQKTGVGYYKYKRNRAVPDAAYLQKYLEASRADCKKNGLLTGIDFDALSDKELVEIIMFPVVNECYRVLDEGHVIRASDIDVVSVMGYGFPAFKGGLMHYAATTAGGLKYVNDKLQEFSDKFGATNPIIASFFKPCPRLTKDAQM